MPETLLRTKLLMPPSRPNLVSRPRLIEQLSAGMNGALTLVSAPAGYGKTTLIGEWRAGPGAEMPVAWLSLDASDDDSARFWPYVLAALNTIQEGLADEALSLFRSFQMPPIETLLTILINDLSRFSQDFVLVLDDLHVITAPEVHRMLAFLLDHIPPQMHLVILTRADPPLPLARLRVSAQLVDIRQEDLRFTRAEATTFLNAVMKLGLEADDIEVLMVRTEGWIAGLQLAALSILGQEDPSNMIATFGSGSHYIVDYLVQEVLSRQPESLRIFLLQTSILDRLNEPLCNALTGQSDCGAILKRLEQDNVFLLRLGGECCWYRYHHLFADVARNLLRQTLREQVPELHRRAAVWHEHNGLVPEAIEHALAAEDWEYAGSLIDGYSSIVWRSGEVTRILDWVEELPDEVAFSFPRLIVNYGWACVLTGRYDHCQAVCSRIEPQIGHNLALQVDLLTVQVFLARARGEQERAVELVLKAQEQSEISSVETMALLMLSLSIALWDLGRVSESASAADEAARLAEQAQNWHAWAVMQGFLGLAQAAFGNLHLAKEIYQRVTRPIEGVPRWAGGGFAHVCLSALLYEWDDLEQAEVYALAALRYGQITGHSEIQMNCYRQLAFLYQAQGNPKKAWEVLDKAEQIVRKHPLPRLWGPEHVQIALAQEDLNKALHWNKRIHGEYGAAIHYPAIPLEGAKLALAQGDRYTAADLLATSFWKASRDGIRYAQIEIRILQALVSTEEEQAMDYLCGALAWAEPEGFCRIFVDQGAALIPLLQRAAQMGHYPRYAVHLLSAIEKDVAAAPLAAQPLVEPLSERELQILHLIAAGKSNQAIADELVIALGTVKRHVYNIYGKLNVHSRTECVARARELHLLN